MEKFSALPKTYNLEQIFREIIKISEKIEPFTIEKLWEWTKFGGINEHLNHSLTIHEYSGVPTEGRKTPLHGQRIAGEFLLFDYIAHSPQFSILHYNDFDELVNVIISDGGILNPFTTLQVPIIGGVAADILFSLQYKSDSFAEELDENAAKIIKTELQKLRRKL